MALDIKHERRRLPWFRVALAIILLVLACATGWYMYRWYMHGDPLPVALPALASADPSVDESPVTTEQVDKHTAEPSAPRYLSIPSLGVRSARVFPVGVDGSGMLEAPANISDVAWYDKSGNPGGGSVVLMDGHNGGVTRDGIFAKLGTLKQGDVIEIERGDGQTFRYEVRENQSMTLEEANKTGMKMMMQSAETGKEALNIITCDGKWVPRYQQFDRRIMLRAVLVD